MRFRKVKKVDERVAAEKELEEAQNRFRQTQQRWPEINHLEKWIKNALGGNA